MKVINAALILGLISSASSALSEETTEKITVKATRQKDAIEKSSADVTVIETEAVKRHSADTGEVLARTQGVSVRRSGGLGSDERLSLNGLSDDRIRLFIDGVPLSLAGYDFGLSNIPLNFLKWMEIYRGVVPIKFGADALGGAINLVSDHITTGEHFSSSLTLGSFHTARFTLSGQTHSAETGFLVRATTFHDYAGNDFKVDVKIPDPSGRLQDAEVKRFHDKFRSRGYGLETGFTRRDWADEAIIKVFHSEAYKQIQNNITMTTPYGEPVQVNSSDAVSFRYVYGFNEYLRLDTVSGYTKTKSNIRDTSLCIYDWHGDCIRQRIIPGEITGSPQDSDQTTHSLYTRINTRWTLDDFNALNFSIALTDQSRDGKNKARLDPNAFDRMSLKKELATYVLGIEHELSLFDDDLKNSLFAKAFEQRLETEKSPFATARFQRDRKSQQSGFGDSLVYDFGYGFFGKASYEKAIRLPNSDEIFGDGVLVLNNLEIDPETSENINVGGRYEYASEQLGRTTFGLSLFSRDTKDLILLVGSSDQAFIYQNVYNAKAEGFEASFIWQSPSERHQLGANFTSLDNRNTSRNGSFQTYKGQRIPNQPYRFANANVSLHWPQKYQGVIGVDWNTRFTEEFSRTWESLANNAQDNIVPSQINHSLDLSYLQKLNTLSYSINFEVQNITDQKAFDMYGLQRPGRSYYLKSVIDI